MSKSYYLIFTFLLITQTTISQNLNGPALKDIPHEVFVNDGKNDFDKIFYKDETIEKHVRILHGNAETPHELSIESNSFDDYWSYYKNSWHLIRFKKDQEPFLVFIGKRSPFDEREYVEFYNPRNPVEEAIIYIAQAVPLAYKRHPFTGELILYLHEYPCCGFSSHNILTLRQIYDEIKSTNRFFIGRDLGDMVGPFFPNKVKFDKEYHTLKERTELRWSPAVVEEKAFVGRTESNLIIHYEKGATYKILHDNGNWLFVIFYSGIAHELSKVMHYTNFLHTGVYGWIKK
ncbi:MAG: hypothetical protein WC994_01475 [Brumimicrobium sp.]